MSLIHVNDGLDIVDISLLEISLPGIEGNVYHRPVEVAA